jgi:hypothetical protein
VRLSVPPSVAIRRISADISPSVNCKYGFEIVAEERYTRGDIDFTAQLGRIKASPAAASSLAK